MMDAKVPYLAALPECGVEGCQERVLAQGGGQEIVVSCSESPGTNFRLKFFAFTCEKHAKDFIRMSARGLAVRRRA